MQRSGEELKTQDNMHVFGSQSPPAYMLSEFFRFCPASAKAVAGLCGFGRYALRHSGRKISSKSL